MPHTPDDARYEFTLARAHRALYDACQIADRRGDEGAVDDLNALLREVTRLAEDALKGKRRRRPTLLDNCA